MKITLLVVISGVSLYQGKKTKKYKELGPAKLPCYNLRVLLYISDLFISRFHCTTLCTGTTRHPSSSLHYTSADMIISSSTQFQKLVLLILLNSHFTHGPYGSGIIYPALQSVTAPTITLFQRAALPAIRGMQPPPQ